MANKAYIVANKQQEREVLEKLERKGLVWGFGEKPTEWSPIQDGALCRLPYALITNGYVGWLSLSQLTDEEIVFDGQEEEHMSEKYVVSQKFMNDLEEWKDTLDSNDYEDKPLVGWTNIKNLPVIVYIWLGDEVPDEENNNRLIAIIRWVNGEDVFEVEKPKKWVVRSKDTDVHGDYWYVYVYNTITSTRFTKADATHFDTKEEAQEWANSHQEVVEVGE